MSDGRSDGNPFSFDKIVNESIDMPQLYVSEPMTPEEELQSKRAQQFRTIQDEALNLFMSKNRDYGDAFADFGAVGVLVRLGDKLRRYSSITGSGVSLVKSESLRDTLLDLHNYAAMAIMLLDEDRPPKGQIFE